MSKIAQFFAAAQSDLKTLEVDVQTITAKLFGPSALPGLEATGEEILKSDLGQAILQDAETLLAQVKSGTVSQTGAIIALSKDVVTAARNAGIKIEESIATTVASLSIAKLSGVLKSPPAADGTPQPEPEIQLPAEPTPGES